MLTILLSLFSDFNGYTTFPSIDVVGRGDTNIICYSDPTACKASAYSACHFPVSITLQICDTVQTCAAVNDQSCIKNLGNPSPGNTTYLSNTRCGDGTNATVTTSASGHEYKFCKSAGDAYLGLSKTFALPPFLCEQTCRDDNTCVAFQTNTQACFILTPQGSPYGAYFRLK